MSLSLIWVLGVGLSTLYIFTLHISSLLTLLCIDGDGEVAGCRRGAFVCLNIHSF